MQCWMPIGLVLRRREECLRWLPIKLQSLLRLVELHSSSSGLLNYQEFNLKNLQDQPNFLWLWLVFKQLCNQLHLPGFLVGLWPLHQLLHEPGGLPQRLQPRMLGGLLFRPNSAQMHWLSPELSNLLRQPVKHLHSVRKVLFPQLRQQLLALRFQLRDLLLIRQLLKVLIPILPACFRGHQFLQKLVRCWLYIKYLSLYLFSLSVQVFVLCERLHQVLLRTGWIV